MLHFHTTGRLRAAALTSVVALTVALLGAPTSAGVAPVPSSAPEPAASSAPALPAMPASPRHPAQDPPATEGSTELQKEYDDVLAKEAELLKTLADAQAAKAQATLDLAELAAQTTAMELQLVVATTAATDAEAKAVTAELERVAAEAEVTAAEQRLRDQIVALYVSGGDDLAVLEAVLAAENGNDAGKVLTYGAAMTDATKRLVDDLTTARTTKTEAETAAEEAEAAAQTFQDDVSTATLLLTTARNDKQTLLDQQTLQIATETDTLTLIQSRKVLVESRINALSRASDGVEGVLAALQANQPDFAPGVMIIDNPLPGVLVSSKFGNRHHPILNIDRLHAGADLGAPTGTEIHAAADGFVVLAEVRGGYGNTTVIDHGNSLGTLYGHQSRLLVTAGQEVKRGDVIGLVGSTGLSTGPHLHFETRVKGVPIDPEGIIDFARPVDYSEPDEGD